MVVEVFEPPWMTKSEPPLLPYDWPPKTAAQAVIPMADKTGAASYGPEALDRGLAGLRKENRVMNARSRESLPFMSPGTRLWTKRSSLPTRRPRFPFSPAGSRPSAIPNSNPPKTAT